MTQQRTSQFNVNLLGTIFSVHIDPGVFHQVMGARQSGVPHGAASGVSVWDDRVIAVDPTNLSPDSIWEIVMHEALHMLVAQTMGHTEDGIPGGMSEHQITMLARALWKTLRDNPNLLRSIIAASQPTPPEVPHGQYSCGHEIPVLSSEGPAPHCQFCGNRLQGVVSKPLDGKWMRGSGGLASGRSEAGSGQSPQEQVQGRDDASGLRVADPAGGQAGAGGGEEAVRPSKQSQQQTATEAIKGEPGSG